MSQIRMYYYYRDAPHTVYNLGVRKIFLWLILTLSSHSKQKRILYYFFREKRVPRFISRKQSLEWKAQGLLHHGLQHRQGLVQSGQVSIHKQHPPVLHCVDYPP